MSEDDNKKYEKNIQKLTDQNIENIEKILAEKKRDKPDMNKLTHIAFIMDGNGRWGKKGKVETLDILKKLRQ